MTTILSINLTASLLILGIVLFRALALCQFPRKLLLLLWGIVALRLLIPVSLPVYLPDNSGQTPEQIEVSNVPDYGEIITVPDTAPSTQAAPAPFEFPYESIWLIGVCAVAIFFLVSYIRFRKIFKASKTCENEAVNHWLVTLPLKRGVQVRQSSEIGSPLTYGIFRPVILLPSDMDLSDEKKLQFILTHEAVHIRRFDAALKLLLTVVVCLHWFNPLVWVLYVLANRDIELSCDEAVVKQSGYETRSEYAHILIGLVETRSRRTFPLVSYFGKHAEEERITSLMKVKRYSVPIIVAAVAVLLCSGVFAAFALSTDAPDEKPKQISYAEAFNQSEQVNFDPNRKSDDIAFEIENFAGNSSLSQELEITAEEPYWELVVVNKSTSDIVVDAGSTMLKDGDIIVLDDVGDRSTHRVGSGCTAVIRPSGPWQPGIYIFGFAGGASHGGMQGSAICFVAESAEKVGTFIVGEAQMTPLDGYEEVVADGQINYDNELVSSETTVRMPTETELEVLRQLKNKLETFDGVEVIAIAAETNDKGKITVDIKLAKGNDLTDEQLRELMDLFYSIVPIEQAGQVGVSAVKEIEVIPSGELGGQTYESSYIIPDSSEYVTGKVTDDGSGPVYDHIYVYDTVTGYTYVMRNVTPDDIVEVFPGDRYVVQEEGQQQPLDRYIEVYVPGHQSFDSTTAPSWSDDEEKPVPIILIRDFEHLYSNEYLPIDEVEFSLTADNPSAVYEGSSDKDVVISFVDNGPVTCIVTIEGTESAGTYKCGFGSEGAVRVELAAGASYKVEYRLGVKTGSGGTPGYLEETVDASSGTIKVYVEK